jgi:hypothetical protein
MPGTDKEYPDWRRKLRVVQTLFALGSAQEIRRKRDKF